MKGFRRMLSGFVVLPLIGCGGNAALKSKAIDCATLGTATAPHAKLVYSLPRTLLKVTIPYTVVHQPQPGAAAKTKVKLDKPVQVTAMLAPDPTNCYEILAGEAERSGFMASDLSVTLNGDGLVTAFSADFTDKRPEIIQTFIASLAKIAVMVAAFDDPRLVVLRQRLEENAAKIVEEAAKREYEPENIKARLQMLDALFEERARLQKAIEFVQASRGETSSEKVWTHVLDPAALTEDKAVGISKLTGQGEYGVAIKPGAEFFGGPVDESTMPTVNLRFAVTAEQAAKATTPVNNPKLDTTLDGIVYRSGVPVVVTAQVEVNKAKIDVLREPIRMAQFGPAFVVEAKSKSWSKRKTSAQFDPATGGLTSYGSNSGTAAEAAKALDASIETVKATVEQIRAKQASEELDAMKAEATLLQQELTLLKARKELEDFKKANP